MNRIPISSPRTTRVPAAGWLRALLPASEWDARSDAELLDRFVRYAEQPAFEALLRRHGPLVWSVCRRDLANSPDVDDAFQATFLIFVRKASSIAHGGRIGPWLYGVAYRVARRIREKTDRTLTYEPEAAAMLPDRPQADAPTNEWLSLLDRELQALPVRYQEPLILCELQGLTRKAAAEHLRLREGTLSSRLARGRVLLRKRLLKHGTLLPAGGLAVLLESDGNVRGEVPAELLTRAAGIRTGGVPSGVANLTNEVVRSMFLSKLRIVGATAVALVAIAIGLIAAAAPESKAKQSTERVKTAVVGAPTTSRKDTSKAPVIEGDLASLQGVWDGEQVLEGGSIPAEPIVWGRCIVRGDVAWLLPANEFYPSRWQVRLTPDRNPKWIDLITDGCSCYTTEQTPGGVTPGVYQITTGGWEIALPAGRGKLRPAEFVVDDQVKVVRFRKARPAAVARPEAHRELEGRWTITRQAYPHNNRSAMVDRPIGTVEINSGYLFVQRPRSGGGFLWEAAEYTLDSTKAPKWIDLNFACKKDPWDTSGYGVYDLTKDALRISYRVSAPRSLRTLEFKAGIEEPIVGNDAAKSDSRQPACSLLELKRAESP